MIWGSIERYSDEVLAVSVKNLESFPALSYFGFFVMYYIYMGVSGPSLLIESTDSVIIVSTYM